MNHLAEQITTEQCFAIEFEDRGPNRYMTVRYWEGQNLHRVLICRSQLPATDLTGELGSLSRLLSVVSTKADIVACSGSSVDLLRTVDYSPFFSRAVQSCFRFDQLNLPKMMHKTSYSVFGQIDFFSVLRGLVISLGGAHSEDWYQRSPELAQVNNVHLSSVAIIINQVLTEGGGENFLSSLGLSCDFLSQAISSCKLELSTLPTLCQELIEEWKPITSYLTTHVPQQQGQGVRTRVGDQTLTAFKYMLIRSCLRYIEG